METLSIGGGGGVCLKKGRKKQKSKPIQNWRARGVSSGHSKKKKNLSFYIKKRYTVLLP
jgi:hypothetical protein